MYLAFFIKREGDNMKKLFLVLFVIFGVSIMCFTDSVKSDSLYEFNLPKYKITKIEPHIELSVIATAYWYMDPVDASGTGLAYDGKPAVPNHTIAVDPKVIPLGSRVYVPGVGWCLAHDTGSAINGNKIDIAMDSRERAYEWGKREVYVKIILPNQEPKYRIEFLPKQHNLQGKMTYTSISGKINS